MNEKIDLQVLPKTLQAHTSPEQLKRPSSLLRRGNQDAARLLERVKTINLPEIRRDNLRCEPAAYEYALAKAYDRGFWRGKQWTESDLNKASYWYHRAAEKGNDLAQYRLGEMYTAGDGTDKNLETASEWFQKAAENGKYGPATESRFLTSMKLAASGDVDGQYELARLYSRGCCPSEGNSADSEAAKWYAKAVGHGHDDAEYELGKCYLLGRGVPQETKEALRLLHMKAACGHVAASYLLGNCYSGGLDGHKDLRWAKTLYKISAENGHVEAMHKLGDVYERGATYSYRVYSDRTALLEGYSTAMSWYRRAADRGDAEALAAYERICSSQELSSEEVEAITNTIESIHGLKTKG